MYICELKCESASYYLKSTQVNSQNRNPWSLKTTQFFNSNYCDHVVTTDNEIPPLPPKLFDFSVSPVPPLQALDPSAPPVPPKLANT